MSYNFPPPGGPTEPTTLGTWPPEPPRRKRHPFRWLFGIVGLIVGLVVVGAAAAGLASSPTPGSHKAAPAATAPAAAAATTASSGPPPSPTPTPAPVLRATRVKFVVTGTGNPDITYGSDSDNRDGGGHLGFDGTGNALPWRASMRFRGDAQYYSIDAQLNGAGDITCKIVVTGPDIAPLTVSSGHASGQYNICSAQAAPNDSQGTSWQNEG